jgi:multiple sugar transport system permease protein
MKKAKSVINKGIPYFFLLLLALIFIFPILIMVCTSFKTMDEAFAAHGSFFPTSFYLGNYANVFDTIPFFKYLGNTMFVTILNVLGTVIVTPMIAYSLSKLRWRGRDIIFSIITASMMIPYTATMIPLYKIWVKAGLVGSFWPLIIPAFFGYPFYIILLRQFMLSIPDDLLEAAKIDGCGSFGRYAKIVLPLCKPGIATITIFAFMNTYSDFLAPLLYANNADHYTLSIGLQSFMNEHSVEWTSLMAAATMFMIPIIILFLVAQKYFIEGISTSGLK